MHRGWLFHRNVHSFGKFNPLSGWPCRAFWQNFQKTQKKSESKHKKKFLWHGLLLCPLVAMKNDKPEICQTLYKVASQRRPIIYEHEWVSKPNDQIMVMHHA